MWQDHVVPAADRARAPEPTLSPSPTASPASANRRSPTCSVKPCSEPPTRSWPPMPGRKRSTSASRRSARTRRPPRTSSQPAAAIVREALGRYVWATGDTTWAGAIGERLGILGWRVAVVEIGTGGQVGTLFGDVEWVRACTSIAGDDIEPERRRSAGPGPPARDETGAEVGLAVHASRGTDDTAVSIAVVTPDGETVEHARRSSAERTAGSGRRSPRPRSCWSSLDLPRGAPKP